MPRAAVRPAPPTDPPTVPGCPRCAGVGLDFWQPSPAMPEVVIGFCESCGALYRARPAAGDEGFEVDPDALGCALA